MAALVIGHLVIDVVHHHESDIDTNQVMQLEGSRLRSTDHRPSDRIDLLDTQTRLLLVDAGGAHAENPDPIGYEIRSVLALDNALAQTLLGELPNGGEDLLGGVRPPNQLEQVHITRRVEEMGDQEIGRVLKKMFKILTWVCSPETWHIFWDLLCSITFAQN